MEVVLSSINVPQFHLESSATTGVQDSYSLLIARSDQSHTQEEYSHQYAYNTQYNQDDQWSMAIDMPHLTNVDLETQDQSSFQPQKLAEDIAMILDEIFSAQPQELMAIDPHLGEEGFGGVPADQLSLELASRDTSNTNITISHEANEITDPAMSIPSNPPPQRHSDTDLTFVNSAIQITALPPCQFTFFRPVPQSIAAEQAKLDDTVETGRGKRSRVSANAVPVKRPCTHPEGLLQDIKLRLERLNDLHNELHEPLGSILSQPKSYTHYLPKKSSPLASGCIRPSDPLETLVPPSQVLDETVIMESGNRPEKSIKQLEFLIKAIDPVILGGRKHVVALDWGIEHPSELDAPLPAFSDEQPPSPIPFKNESQDFNPRTWPSRGNINELRNPVPFVSSIANYDTAKLALPVSDFTDFPYALHQLAPGYLAYQTFDGTWYLYGYQLWHHFMCLTGVTGLDDLSPSQSTEEVQGDQPAVRGSDYQSVGEAARVSMAPSSAVWV